MEDIYIENSKFYNKIGYMNLSSIDDNMNKKIYEKNYIRETNPNVKFRINSKIIISKII